MTTRPIILLALAAFFAALPEAQARRPRARQTSGTIEAVDLAQQRIVVRRDDGAEPLALTYNRITRIWRGLEAVDAGALERGQRVTVSYRRPLFTPDYASRLALLSPANPTTTPNYKTTIPQ